MRNNNWLLNTIYISIFVATFLFLAGCCTQKKVASSGVMGSDEKCATKVCCLINSSEQGLDSNGDKDVTLQNIRWE